MLFLKWLLDGLTSRSVLFCLFVYLLHPFGCVKVPEIGFSGGFVRKRKQWPQSNGKRYHIRKYSCYFVAERKWCFCVAFLTSVVFVLSLTPLLSSLQKSFFLAFAVLLSINLGEDGILEESERVDR